MGPGQQGRVRIARRFPLPHNPKAPRQRSRFNRLGRRYRTQRRSGSPLGDGIGVFWNGDLSRRSPSPVTRSSSAFTRMTSGLLQDVGTTVLIGPITSPRVLKSPSRAAGPETGPPRARSHRCDEHGSPLHATVARSATAPGTGRMPAASAPGSPCEWVSQGQCTTTVASKRLCHASFSRCAGRFTSDPFSCIVWNSAITASGSGLLAPVPNGRPPAASGRACRRRGGRLAAA